MRKYLVSAMLACAAMSYSAAATDDFTPLRLTGCNADVVVAPGEAFKDALNSDGMCFYSEDKSLRGGLPATLRGMFSDTPYTLADFNGKCAVRLSADGTSSDGTAFGSGQTVSFATPVSARSLWLLVTGGASQSTVSVTVNHSDGTAESAVALDIPSWVSEDGSGTAFWQLGAVESASESYKHALYERVVPVSDTTKTVASLTLTLDGNSDDAVLFAVTASGKEAPDTLKSKRLFFISDSHLDTQWNWTVETTISQYIKNTLEENFQRFEDTGSKNFKLNFEGAIKYMWAKEYYPDYYSKLKEYISAGKWNIAGAAVDASDVNIGSAESLIRNFLYGQTFYKQEFGQRGGRDIMLPDCFGFPWSLPSVAAHCGMKYFHTQKLSWSSAYAYNDLPRFARWVGTDGEEVLSVLKMNAYDAHEDFQKDMSADSDMENEIADNTSLYGIPATFKYVGPRGDRGGGLDETTAEWLSKSVDGSGSLGVALNSSTEMLDQAFHMGYDSLPVIEHGLPMRAHGVGGYTSRCMLKFWNRKGELLGGTAEKASVAADWLGSLPYQRSTLSNAWIRLLWHQFHDDLPGTCINDAYKYTVNDQVLNQLDFSRTLNNAVGAVARSLNTSWCENVPVVVYNPLSVERTDIVEASVTLSEEAANVVVTDPDGNAVPSQVLDSEGCDVKLIFLATVPSMGYATYNIAPTDDAPSLNSSLQVSEDGVENDRYRLTIDSNGDVSSIIDKAQNDKELLSAPIRLAMLFDESLSWPSWEIHGDQLQNDPREYVDDEGLKVEIDENGPLRVSLKITRTKSGSTFCQLIRLASAGSENRIDFVNEVNWQTKQRMLKATFPLTASNTEASYDLDLGVDVNSNSTSYSTDVNSTDAHCEFLGHRWADVTNQDNSFGVSILNDCKYGWDKQKDNEIRLTLIHTPKVGDSYSYQGSQDLGLNKFTYSFFAHTGSWNADTQWEADKLNEPLLAYQTTQHSGGMGTSFGFVKVNNDNVAVKTMKKAELSDKTIVRFYELTNNAQDVEAEFPADIISAEEVNGVEELTGDADFSGKKLTFRIDRFHPKTFALTFAEPDVTAAQSSAPTSTSVGLDYNIDVMSNNENRSDADIDKAYPAELVGDSITADGIVFAMGDRADGADNAVKCEGQTVSIPSADGGRKLYLLASSLNEEGSDVSFLVDGKEEAIRIEYNGGYVGVWSNSTDVKKSYRMENTAFTATHNHDTGSATDGVYDYLYMYKYVISLPESASTLTLPNDPDVLIYAISLSDNENDDTTPLSQVVQVLDHVYTEDTYKEITHEDPALTPTEVSASAYTGDSEKPEKAADGDEDTKWCDNSSKSKWLEYKFGKDVAVSGWRVVNAGCEGESSIASEYWLQRYVNNGWVDVCGVYDNETNTTDMVIDRPFVTSAVRLRMVKSERSGDGAARVYEFSVYGRDATSEDSLRSQIISRRPSYGFGKQVAKIKSSSGRVNANEDPYFILDSDRTTKWCYNGSVSKPNVVVDLTDVYLVDSFDIYDARTMEDRDNSDEYIISVSLDGSSYTQVLSKTEAADEAVHRCGLAEAVPARYVKLQMSKGGGGAVRVYGFDIWGVFKEKTAEVSGEPVSLSKTVLGSYGVKNFKETALNLLDGNSDSSEFTWNFDKTGTEATYIWMVVDLEDTYSIDKFVIYDNKGANSTTNIKGYRIYTATVAPTEDEMATFHKSTSGSKWTRVATSSSDDADVKTIELESPATARYVKLLIPRTCVTDSAMLREFEVYGTLASTGVPAVSAGGGIEIWPEVVRQGGDVHVSVPSEGRYTLCNTVGAVVSSGTASGETLVPTGSTPPGVYLLNVTAGQDRLCKKIVVRKSVSQ